MIRSSYSIMPSSFKPSFKRHEQLSPAVSRIASLFLQKNVDPGDFCMITITRVVVTPDLGYATLWVHSIRNREKLLHYLRPHLHHLQKELFESLAMRRVPQVRFKLDENSEYVEKITKLLDRL